MSKSITVCSTDELEARVAEYAKRGFEVIAMTPRRAVVYKRKQFSIPMGIIGFLFCIVGLVVYTIIYAAKSDQSVEIIVDETV